MQDKSPLTLYEQQERAADARACLNSKAVADAFDDIRDEYLNELIQAEVGGLTAASAHAKVKALADLRLRLQSYVTDEEMLHRSKKLVRRT